MLCKIIYIFNCAYDVKSEILLLKINQELHEMSNGIFTGQLIFSQFFHWLPNFMKNKSVTLQRTVHIGRNLGNCDTRICKCRHNLKSEHIYSKDTHATGRVYTRYQEQGSLVIYVSGGGGGAWSTSHINNGSVRCAKDHHSGDSRLVRLERVHPASIRRFTRFWCNVGPTSKMVGQHYTRIG